MTAPVTVLQISDAHLQASAAARLLGVDTADSLRAVLDQALLEHRPDAVVASGDLAHDPVPASYQRFRELLEAHFDGPVLYLPGNHDLTVPLQRVLGVAAGLRVGSWHIIGFDSHADGRTEACLDGTARRNLDARIHASDADHVLLVCHHPPLPVGCPWLDKDCIPAGLELLESCAAHPRVRGLVFGHVHQEVQASVGGMTVLGTPSTCFQFQPHSRRFAIDRSEATGQPGYRWLRLQADGGLGSEVRRVGDYVLNIDLSDRV
jgi:Icc protein